MADQPKAQDSSTSNLITISREENVSAASLLGDNNKFFTPYNTVELTHEVPVDWPCRRFYFDTDGLLRFEDISWATVRRILTVFWVVAVYVGTASVDGVLFTRLSKTLMIVIILFSEIIYPLAFEVVIWIFLLFRKLYEVVCSARKNNTKVNLAQMPSPSLSQTNEGGEDDTEEDNIMEPVPEVKNCCLFLNREYLWVMFVIALSDTVSSLLMLGPVIAMDPILRAVCDVMTELPINMAMGKFYAQKSYKFPHYTGIGMIIISAIVMLTSNPNAQTDHGIRLSAVDGIWLLLIILAQIPSTFGRNYKEWHLKDKNLDVWCTTTWVGLFQLLLSPLFALTVLIPMPDYNETLPDISTWDDGNKTISIIPMGGLKASVNSQNLGSYMKFGFECVFADFTGNYPNTIYNYTNHTDADFVDNGIQCHSVGHVVLAFIIINVVFNIFLTDLLKLTTSNITAAISVLNLGTKNFIFAIPALAGAAYRPNNWMDFVPLIGVSLGIATFWSMPEIMNRSTMAERSKKTIQPSPSTSTPLWRSVLAKCPCWRQTCVYQWLLWCIPKDKTYINMQDLSKSLDPDEVEMGDI